MARKATKTGKAKSDAATKTSATKTAKPKTVAKTFASLNQVIASSRETAEAIFADLTRGSKTASGKTARTVAEEPTIESVFGPATGAVAIQERAVASPVDMLLVRLNEMISRSDFAGAAKTFKACLGNPAFPRNMQTALIPLMSANSHTLHCQRSHLKTRAPSDKVRLEDAVRELHEALSAFNMKVLQMDEGYRLSQSHSVTIEFPPCVDVPVVLAGVPIVVLTEKAVDSPELHRLSTCLYLVELAKVVGVPMGVVDLNDDDSLQEVYDQAQQYAFKNGIGSLVPRMLVHAESDGAWFMQAPSGDGVIVRELQFADDFHKSRAGSTLDPALRRLRTERIRQRRMDFEAKHHDLLARIKTAEVHLEGMEDKAREDRAVFQEAYGCLPSASEINLRKHVDRQLKLDLAGELSLEKRLAIRKDWNDDVLLPALTARAAYAALRAKIRGQRAILKLDLAELDKQKEMARAPLAVAHIEPLQVAVAEAKKQIELPSGLPKAARKKPRVLKDIVPRFGAPTSERRAASIHG